MIDMFMPSKHPQPTVPKSETEAHACCGGNGECVCSDGCACSGEDCGCGEPHAVEHLGPAIGKK